MDKSDHERIVELFESRSKCAHGNHGHVDYVAGCTTVNTNGKCLCQLNDGEGHPLSTVLATWLERFGA
jgi:hypothetical protein